DLKPANVLIDPHGHPVITDFGISGASGATGITSHGDLLGSPGFMAPEVVRGMSPSPASDQYALGRLLFELGAQGEPQKLPMRAPIFEVLRSSLRMDWSRLPRGGPWPKLEQILKRMTLDAPESRFPSAKDALIALRGVSMHG